MTNKEPQVLVDARRIVALEPIIKAYMGGKDIQVKLDGREEWQDVTWLSPNWASGRCEWRIKQEPEVLYRVYFTTQKGVEYNDNVYSTRTAADAAAQEALRRFVAVKIVKYVEVPE